MKKRRYRGYILPFLIIAGFILFGAYNIFSRKGEPVNLQTREDLLAPVHVEPVKKRPAEMIIRATATVAPERLVNVVSKVYGENITAVYVEEGQVVKKGDRVARIDDRLVRAKISEAMAELKAAEAARGQALARLRLLEKDRDRLAALFAQKAVARQRLDHIEAELTSAEKALKLAEAKMERARAVIEQLNIHKKNHLVTAPADGLVIKKHVDPGSLSAPSMPIITIADTTVVKVVASLNEENLSWIREGMPAEVIIDASGERIKGAISRIGTVVDPATRSLEVEIKVINRDRMLKPGMFARIEIPRRFGAMPAIPREAVIRIPGTGTPYVFVVQKERAVLKNIVIGLEIGPSVFVEKGLLEGELVVTKGQQLLKDGIPVRVVDNDLAG